MAPRAKRPNAGPADSGAMRERLEVETPRTPNLPWRSISWASNSSAAMRLSVFGWVANRSSMPRPQSGFTMNRCAEEGCASALSSTGRLWSERRRNAAASHLGSPQISAPSRSAAYSRVRLIAI